MLELRATVETFDPDCGSAVDAAEAIRSGSISSLELTQHTLRRIDTFEPRLNAYVYELREEALRAAKRADEAIAQGGPTGLLHGVPINVKESFAVQGQPCTWGIPALRGVGAPYHSTAVQRLLNAGAILLGATNVPFQLMDGQAFNDIYGRSNNPWDLERTPGGSSGGTAASLAAGLAFLSIGSDLGGSIRSPASFCGIYGHKPTLDLVPFTGHAPAGKLAAPGFSTLLAAAGPMARYARDLQAGLGVLAGPEKPDDKAMHWALPTPRHKTISEYRVGFVLEDPLVPVCSETKSVLEHAVRVCERAGARLNEGWPPDVDFGTLLDCYYFHLGAFDYSMTPPEFQVHARNHLDTKPRTWKSGALSSFASWQAENLKRLAIRAQWEGYFKDTDVFLLPTTFTAAFRHDPTPLDVRKIRTADGAAHPGWNLVTYICPATLTGCPATTAPVGLTRTGLPVGLQIMGAFGEDATPIQFAALLASEMGGFQPPPGYAALPNQAPEGATRTEDGTAGFLPRFS